MKQQAFIKKESSAYGGELLKTRKGRSRGRPLDTKHSMHLVLRSSLAVKEWSFTKQTNAHKVKSIIEEFAAKYGIKIISLANVGNHLHMQIKLSTRRAYEKFIRAISASIVMAITGASRWKTLAAIFEEKGITAKGFWDYRPFTRVVASLREILNLRDYIEINKTEGYGYTKKQARFMLEYERATKDTKQLTNKILSP